MKAVFSQLMRSAVVAFIAFLFFVTAPRTGDALGDVSSVLDGYFKLFFSPPTWDSTTYTQMSNRFSQHGEPELLPGEIQPTGIRLSQLEDFFMPVRNVTCSSFRVVHYSDYLAEAGSYRPDFRIWAPTYSAVFNIHQTIWSSFTHTSTAQIAIAVADSANPDRVFQADGVGLNRIRMSSRLLAQRGYPDGLADFDMHSLRLEGTLRCEGFTILFSEIGRD